MKSNVLAAIAALIVISLAPAVSADEREAGQKFAQAVQAERGDKMVRSFGRALALYCESAQHGHAEAAYNVAWMYLNGTGMRRDVTNGTAWLRVAAQRGNEAAIRWLDLVGTLTAAKPPHCRATIQAARVRQVPPEVMAMVTKAAAEFELDPNLVLAVMATESAFRADAVSPRNAKGLMQLTDDTARRFGVNDVFAPEDNIRGGAQYLRWLLRYFDGDLERALAGYNAGEKAVVRHGGVPPYAETRAYLEKIRSRYPVAEAMR